MSQGWTVNFPEWDGQMRTVLEVLHLRKGRHSAECLLVTHPLSAEVRVSIDGELHRSEAGRDGMKLMALALDWRDQFQAKGWEP